jgi:hypothetical protein
VPPSSLIALMMEAVSTSETSVNFYQTSGATSQKTAIFMTAMFALRSIQPADLPSSNVAEQMESNNTLTLQNICAGWQKVIKMVALHRRIEICAVTYYKHTGDLASSDPSHAKGNCS